MARRAQLADGRILEFPDNTPDEVMDRVVRREIANPSPPPEEENLLERVPIVGGALAGAADIPLSAVEGLAGTLGSFTDLFGANNAASQFLGDVAEGAGEMRSSGSREDEATSAREMQEAEGKGVWEEIKAAGRAVARAPFETAASLAGSAVPFIGAGLAASAAAPASGVRVSLYSLVMRAGPQPVLPLVRVQLRAAFTTLCTKRRLSTTGPKSKPEPRLSRRRSMSGLTPI